MAGTKEIKNRINSIKDTKKITNAMYLIASTKMRKAKSDTCRGNGGIAGAYHFNKEWLCGGLCSCG
ncbi:MAG: F0F1 ATP synthase subunit gamma [Oscillospiraceae bacterium]|nr:F0F1 ATP synthase subunit gamma [Oscillospiraceae bacterium]